MPPIDSLPREYSSTRKNEERPSSRLKSKKSKKSREKKKKSKSTVGKIKSTMGMSEAISVTNEQSFLDDA